MRSSTLQRALLSCALALTVGLVGVACWPGLTHTAVIVAGAVGYLGCAAVAGAALLNRRTAATSPWWLYLASLPAAGIAQVSVLRNLAGATPDSPLGWFFVASTALGSAGLFAQASSHGAWRDLRGALDSLIMSTAVCTAMASAFWTGSTHGHVPQSMVTLLAADALLALGMARLWFSPATESPAVRVVVIGPLGPLVDHVAWSFAGVAEVRVAEVWHLATVLWPLAVMWGAFGARPLHTLDLNRRRTRPETPHEGAALVACLLTPGALLFAVGAAGLPVPWVVISLGGATVTLLSVGRLAMLLGTVRRQQEQVELLANHDPLTGAANRRLWDAHIRAAQEVNGKDGVKRWLALLDLDYFKAFNDTHGHQAGDEMLRATCAAWQQHLAGDALLARYGGEEFALLLAAESGEAAVAALTRLREAVPGTQTCSVGVARWLPHMSADEVMRDADIALYEAKAAGRDRVMLAPGRETAMHLPRQTPTGDRRDLRRALERAADATHPPG